MEKKVVLYLLLLLALVFAQEGTLNENVILTDVKGETIDMYAELDNGKHILVFLTSAN